MKTKKTHQLLLQESDWVGAANGIFLLQVTYFSLSTPLKQVKGTLRLYNNFTDARLADVTFTNSFDAISIEQRSHLSKNQRQVLLNVQEHYNLDLPSLAEGIISTKDPNPR